MKRNFFLFIALLSTAMVYAQSPIEQTYQQGVADFLPIYSGIQEFGYPRGYENTPYWPQQFTAGKITYFGTEYSNVAMRIDTYRQQLIALSPDGRRSIELQQAYVENIHIGGEEFVWLSKADGAPASAYYAVTRADGELFYTLHTTSCTQKIEDRQILKTFHHNTRHYHVKDGKWKKISPKTFNRITK